MKTLLELRQARAELSAQVKAATDQYKDALIPKEIREEIKTKLSSIRDLDDQILDIEESDNLLNSVQSTVKREDSALSISRNQNVSGASQSRPILTHPNINPSNRKCGFDNVKDFFKCVLEAGVDKRQVADLLRPLVAQREIRGNMHQAVGSDEMSTVNDPFGGFLVPEAFAPTILQTSPETDFIQGRTTSIPMEASTLRINARVDKDHSTSVTGGLRVYRRAETQDVTPSRAEYEQVVLNAESLFGLAYISEELLFDSPVSIPALLEQSFSEEFTSKLMSERLSGTGVGQMEGILNSGSLVTVAKEAGQAADTIVSANLLKMRMRSWRYGNAIWMANLDTYEQLAACNVAGTNSDVFLFNPARGIDVPDTLLGRPIFFTEYTETLGDAGDIVLANWSQYLEGSYQPVQGASSIHVRFANHERAFKFFMRNDGKSWWNSALTPVKGANTLSPFITLAARA